MSKRRGLLITAACALAVSVIVAWLLRDNEPQYRGRSLHHWVEILGDPELVYDRSPYATQALRHAGTNALPLLLKWAAYEVKPSPVKELADHLTRRNPSGYFVKAFRHWAMSRDNRANGTVVAFGELGGIAEPAIPVLRELAGTSADQGCALRAVECLTAMGEPALPALLSLSTNSNTAVRVYVTVCLTHFGNNPEVIAALARSLNDSDAFLAGFAAATLRSIAPAALTNSPAR
jgi:hypothetical protein